MNGAVKTNGVTSKEESSTMTVEDPQVRDERHSYKYWRALQTFKPLRFDKQSAPSPIDNANFFSFMTFQWITKYILKAKDSIKPEDLPPLSVYDATHRSVRRMERLYKEDGDKHDGKPKIGRTVYQFIKTRMIASIALLFISLTATFLGPAFLINKLINFAELESPTVGYGIGLTVGLGVTEFTRSLLFSFFFGMNYRTAIRARGGVLSMIFKKVARLRSLKDKSVGEIVNLISNDSQRIFDMIVYAGILVGAPYMIVMTMVFTCIYFGWTALIGILSFILFIPIQMVIGRKMADYRRKCVKVTDRRVRMMNEILTCVKLIKMYAWEESFAKAIGKIRKEERGILQKSGFIQSFQVSVVAIVPVLSTVLTFIVHTLLGYPLDAATAFTIISVFNAMRFLMSILPQAVKGLAEVFVSFGRIDELLSMEEIEDYCDEPRDPNNAVEFRNLTAAWDMVEKAENGSEESEGDASSKQISDEDTVDVLFNIDLNVPKKRLLGICGTVGSGKSSFISSLLGELRIHKGSIGLNGTMAYVPQQAWIFHASVRDNILFGAPYDEEKYNRIIRSCSLEMDFKVLTDGDLTEVGERGINLSGGQKQRISLARAVYSNREIILLDDPLSAVDAHVGKHIFFECIKKELSEKTVIFVTHQLQYLKDCDEIILLKEGRVAEQGMHDDLIANNNEYAKLTKNFYLEKESEKPDAVDSELVKKIIRQRTLSGGSNPADLSDVRLDIADIQSSLSTEKFERSTSGISTSRASIRSVMEVQAEGAATFDDNVLDEVQNEAEKDDEAAVLIKGETSSVGSVSGHTYYTYFKAAGGIFTSVITGLLFILLVFGVTLNNWWLSVWINAGGQVTVVCPSNNDSMGSGELPTGTFQTDEACTEFVDPNISTGDRLGFYQGVYGIILAVTILLGILKSAKYTYSTVGAASTLHNHVFKSVFRSPMSFFDTTPTGRILNRFSKDLDDVDIRLILMMDMFLLQICMVVFSLITMSIVFPYFLIAVAVIAVVFGFIYSYFRSAIREFKRLDNITRSPWFSHVTSSVQGLSTIHSYNKTEEVIDTFNTLLDRNSSPTFVYYCAGRWLSVRLDALTISTTLLVSLFVVFSAVYPSTFGEVSASFAGLALSYAIQLTGLFQVCVRFSVETESYFTSVERIVEYIDTCPTEADPIKPIQPKPSWPDKGEIRFSEASMRYRPNLPLVLKSLKFVIKPKENIGIVGRTGSGKSSLGTALFRLVELNQGRIMIDDVNISDVSIKQLREKLSIIPQEPVLFVGDIRYNLDPFGQYSDDEIWRALERTHMKSAIGELPDKLESQVVENGENFSVGERQLLCMARAILRHSKIIMLDEATAAIDSETDSLVQDTIREAFSDCTMLTIAHRLNTVLTSDKILVMDDGKVAEFDDPAVLLSNPESHFSKMLNAAASNEDKENDFQQQANVVNNNQTDSHPGGFDNLAFDDNDETGEQEYEQTVL